MSTAQHPTTTTTTSTSTSTAPSGVRGPERVLLATDGGMAGVAAVRWLAERSVHHSLEIEAVRVVPGGGTVLSGGAAADLVDAEGSMTEVRDLLHHLAPRSAVRTEVVPGEAIDVLHRRAAGADLVVVGTNRTSRGVPHLVASFAARLVDGSARPVVIVPRGWTPSAGPVVLGALADGSDDAAIGFAAAEAAALGRHLVLVHAWRIAALSAPGGGIDLDEQAIESAESAKLSELSDRLRTAHPGLRVAPVLDRDDPVHALAVASRGAVLVVLGTHGLTAVDRLLLRSVSREVLERPACPVAIVPHP
ncbi:universal stress protein [Amnibacterium kyonggiense]|uniref:Nucleotide-binding universal stress UspA family protein n=1 Tax=Amnibacterium kyonggiense TaxID=595671 RepID=A0A4V3EAP3_9MICO|nr:universal stress protein [Amnibacterium kyonggiense]TDS76854.1 nucleotide-binding universal stress UspA family protein [Amnibacterium kyonggiense]